jgi:hypothetical protein
VAAAGLAAIGGAESGHQYFAAKRAIKGAFAARGASDAKQLDPFGGQQVIDMPAQGLVAAAMPRNARLDVAFGAAGIDIDACRKMELARRPIVMIRGCRNAIQS